MLKLLSSHAMQMLIGKNKTCCGTLVFFLSLTIPLSLSLCLSISDFPSLPVYFCFSLSFFLSPSLALLFTKIMQLTGKHWCLVSTFCWWASLFLWQTLLRKHHNKWWQGTTTTKRYVMDWVMKIWVAKVRNKFHIHVFWDICMLDFN